MQKYKMAVIAILDVIFV